MKPILPLLLALTLLAGCALKPVPQTTEALTEPSVVTTVPPETTAPPKPAGIPLETPCGTLYIPDNWDLPLTAETKLGDPIVITILSEDVPLYDLTFSASTDRAIGMVSMEEGPIYVGMTIHPLEEETDLLLDMQESVNTLLSQLPLEAVPEAPAESGAGEDLLILTPYGSLHFPVMWEECLETEQPGEDVLEFYCALPEHENILLFTLRFGTEDGNIAAAITAPDGTVTDVSLTVAPLEFDDTWTPQEQDLVFAMQEDMNYLLRALSR